MQKKDALDNMILPTNDMMEYLPGEDTISSSKSVILQETMQQFDYILAEQDEEDPAVIAHHLEEDTFKVAV